MFGATGWSGAVASGVKRLAIRCKRGANLMRRFLRRYWSALAMMILACAVMIAHHAAERDREKSADRNSNWTEIEDGLAMGGFLDRLPPGTDAVLNLCENRDEYESAAPVHQWEAIQDAAPAPSIEWLRQRVAFVDEQRRAR
jgi:hypothetical protein